MKAIFLILGHDGRRRGAEPDGRAGDFSGRQRRPVPPTARNSGLRLLADEQHAGNNELVVKWWWWWSSG